MKKIVLISIYIIFVSIIGGCNQSESNNNAEIYRDGYTPQGVSDIEPYDINDDTPDVVVKQHFAYEVKKDWESMFYLYSDDIPVTINEFISMHHESRIELIDYLVSDFVITGETDAAVKVGYLVDYDGDQKLFIEWWSCVKNKGVWKLEWLPRQG